MATVSVEGDELVFRTKLNDIDDYTLRLIQECAEVEPSGERKAKAESVEPITIRCPAVYVHSSHFPDLHCLLIANHHDLRHRAAMDQGRVHFEVTW